MSPAEAAERADQIIADLAHGDPEGAHGDQDEFYVAALRAIVASKPDPWVRMIAEQAIRVAEAPGTRWYA